MKVGIFGTGNVGRTMAERFLADENEVMIGTRNVRNTLEREDRDNPGHLSYQEWQKKHPQIRLGTFAETAAFGDIVVLATLGNATQHAIDMAGVKNFASKIVIDMTNPLDFSNGIPPRFTGTLGNSLGEQIQKLLPEAKVVKAFNSVSVQIVVNPKREEGDPVMFIAGDDESAKQTVSEIAKKWGWKDLVDFGSITESYFLEAFAMMWIHYAFKNNSWTHAFKFLRK
ncbi:MAG: NAD(P)-binding domain-containing protein [Thermoflavifilum aggregans]|nr:NAD(P)-binding domain-containing protein [Thermoflavifilum aggregans]